MGIVEEKTKGHFQSGAVLSRERQTATLTEKHTPKKKNQNHGAGGVLLGCSPACCRFVLLLVGPFCPKWQAMASSSRDDDGSSVLGIRLDSALTVLRHSGLAFV